MPRTVAIAFELLLFAATGQSKYPKRAAEWAFSGKDSCAPCRLQAANVITDSSVRSRTLPSAIGRRRGAPRANRKLGHSDRVETHSVTSRSRECADAETRRRSRRGRCLHRRNPYGDRCSAARFRSERIPRSSVASRSPKQSWRIGMGKDTLPTPGGDDPEVRFLTENTDLSPKQARELIAEHGHDREKLLEIARTRKAEG